MSGWLLLMAMGVAAVIGAAAATRLVTWRRPHWSTRRQTAGGLLLLLGVVAAAAAAGVILAMRSAVMVSVDASDDPGAALAGLIVSCAMVQAALCLIVGYPVAEWMAAHCAARRTDVRAATDG